MFSAPLDFETIDLIFDVTATARNSDTVTETAVITLSGSVELADAGQLSDPWALTGCFGISADGVSIVGSGHSARQRQEAWLATLPMGE